MEPVIKRLEINAFRGIEGLVLENLSTINILAGINNSGKTSVLEAVQILSAPYSRKRLLSVAYSRTSRSLSRTENLVLHVKPLFHKGIIDLLCDINGVTYSYCFSAIEEELIDETGEDVASIHISGLVSKDTTEQTNFSYDITDGMVLESLEKLKKIFPTEYFGVGVNYYKKAVRLLSKLIKNEISSKKSKAVTDTILPLMKIFDPHIKNIHLKDDDIIIEKDDIDDNIALFHFGSGLQKTVLLAALVISATDGVILIDEIDNAINISAFRKIFPWFVEACQTHNIQAFITTHSVEAIDAILDYQRDSDTDDIRVITLRKTPKTGRTIAKIRTGKEARSDRERFEMELRI